MAKKYDHISVDIQQFIKAQHLFFVSTAPIEGKINLSPKGMDSLRVISPNRIVWLNLTGSGNETAAHLQENDRMTIMFCAFEGKPLILRLYGYAKIYHTGDKEWDEHFPRFPAWPGARQIVVMDVDMVQTSCGFAVPLMDYKADRQELEKWATKQGDDKLKAYFQENNAVSIDGKVINPS